jgi:hypothetical protein
VLFGIGLALSLVMVWRSNLQGDQLNMLIRGWTFAFKGEWLHFGQPTSAGGMAPGGLLSLLVGWPLRLWPDDRAATLLVWLTGVAGYLILDRMVGRAAGSRGRLLFAVFYWLNPWRMHYTSSLWNPNYMFFLAAVHAWCCERSSQQRRFWWSTVLVLIPGLGFQLHGAAVAFGFASVMLWWRRLIRVNWWGVAAGITATAAAYAPWFVTVASRPELMPGSTGFPLRNLLLVQPLVRGLGYLVRYPSLAMPGRVYGLNLVSGSSSDDTVSWLLSAALVVIGWLSVLLPLAAYGRWLRGRRRLWPRRQWSGSARLWLRGYAAWSLTGAVVSFAVSPTSVMYWQGFPVFHSATLVVVFFWITLLRSRRGSIALRLAAGWAVAATVATVAIAIGSPLFRTPGPPVSENYYDGDYARRIARDHPMYHDLNLIERHRMILVDEGGYTPDLLRE